MHLLFNLIQDEIFFTGIKGFKVNWRDLVGVQPIPPVDDKYLHYNIVLFYYPFVKQTFGGRKRERQKIYIQVQVDGDQNEKGFSLIVKMSNSHKTQIWHLL